MGKVSAVQNASVQLVRQRADQLQKLVGEARINQFMANVLAELRPVNAQGKPNGLLKCDPGSFYAACHQAATLNLMPGPLRECSLVPYGKVATLIVEYRGFATLALRHPDVENIKWDAVYKGDHFIHNRVTGHLEHEREADIPADYMDDKNLIGAWCRVKLRNSSEPVPLYMPRCEIDKRKKNTNFWRDWYQEMAIKTVVRKLLNSGQIPRSSELVRAIDYDLEQERKAEVLSEKSEKPERVATDVQVGFDDPVEQDYFGLEAEPEPRAAPTDERSDIEQQIQVQCKRLKLKDNQLLDVARQFFGPTVLGMDEFTTADLASFLNVLEGMS